QDSLPAIHAKSSVRRWACAKPARDPSTPNADLHTKLFGAFSCFASGAFRFLPSRAPKPCWFRRFCLQDSSETTLFWGGVTLNETPAFSSMRATFQPVCRLGSQKAFKGDKP